MAAISKNSSAQKAYMKHITKAKIPVRRRWGYFFTSTLNSQRSSSPAPMVKTKKPTALSSVIPTLPPPFIPVITLRVMIPSTSSMIAALKIVVPTRVFSFPSSRSVSTVIPTLVAARILPTNRAFISMPWPAAFPGQPINSKAPTVPRATGTSTPIIAIADEAAPLRLSSRKSVSSPLEKRINTTPICEKLCSTSISASVGCIIPIKPPGWNCPMIAGPIKSPAIIMPTTCGSPSLRDRSPSSFVASRITAQSNRMSITLKSIHSLLRMGRIL